MKVFGYFLIGIGVVYLLIAFNMDVSVSTSSTYVPGYGAIGGGSVANLNLMAQRQNHLLVAGLITLIGALMAIFGKDQGRSNGTESSDRSMVLPSANFNGEHDLASDGYRLWLARHYQIERNEVFNRFVLGEQTFENLDNALVHAHALEMEKIAAKKAESERVEAETAANREAARIATEEADAQWKETRPKMVVATVIAIGLSVAAYFLLMDRPVTNGTSSSPATQATAKANDAVAAAKITPDALPTPVIDPTILATTDGMMGIAAGQSWESASSQFNLVGQSGADDPNACEIYESRNQRVSAMVEDGKVTRIETSDRRFRTPSNIGVGSTLADLRNAYGSRLNDEENPYAGRDYFVHAQNGNGIKFHVERDRVTDLTVGSSSIRYVEGCL
jgi:hypothetical protein